MFHTNDTYYSYMNERRSCTFFGLRVATGREIISFSPIEWFFFRLGQRGKALTMNTRNRLLRELSFFLFNINLEPILLELFTFIYY